MAKMKKKLYQMKKLDKNFRNVPGVHFENITLSMKLNYQIRNYAKNLMDFARFSYLAIVMVLLLIVVVEIKNMYQIDIFPGIDTPIDNAYFAGKNELGNVL
jgi:hypothetical protein